MPEQNSDEEQDDLIPVPIEEVPQSLIGRLSVNAVEVTDDQGRDLLSTLKKFQCGLPFLLLFILKFVVDNIMRLLFLVTLVISLNRINSRIHEQLSLKGQANKSALVLLFCANSVLLMYTIMCSEFLLGDAKLFQRLSFQYYAFESQTYGILEILWFTIMTDYVVQAFIANLKIFLCITMVPGINRKCCIRSKRLSNASLVPNQQQSLSTSSHSSSRDLEAGRTTIDDSTGGINIQSELLRRRDCNSVTSTSPRESSPVTGNSSTALMDDSVIEASFYLLKTKTLSVVNVTGLIYRSILPISLWIAYFGNSPYGPFFVSSYLFCKFFDLSWKIRGLIEAVVNFIFGKMEYGRQSTTQEMEHHGDCPICFDSPHNPVTLSECGHLFCEVCVSEWLEKEKTCPVCRKEVKLADHWGSIKEQASNMFPVLI
jgi:hypothetical protein